MRMTDVGFYMQRKLGIGYQRAASLYDRLGRDETGADGGRSARKKPGIKI
jgi:DNA segregation ATPase FtsK/SpoIIIE-like protein